MKFIGRFIWEEEVRVASTQHVLTENLVKTC